MSSSKFFKKVRYALRFLPDSFYIQLNYFGHFHRFADLKNPKTYNEKLNWLKLHNHDPIYSKYVDKYTVKAYVDSVIGEGYCVPTIGVWESFDEIDFDSLPNQFVLKCTHDSEGIVIVKDKCLMEESAVKRKITAALKQNFYYIGREWPYRSLKPRIIAEPFLIDDETGELRDYKFFCFDGEPKVLFIASDRAIDDVRFDYFDMDFKHLDIKQKYPNASKPIKKPRTFEQMIELSRKLSKGFVHVRVDFYEVNGKVYFGELTFYHFSGFMPFQPRGWDEIFGEWLKLPAQTSNALKTE